MIGLNTSNKTTTYSFFHQVSRVYTNVAWKQCNSSGRLSLGIRSRAQRAPKQNKNPWNSSKETREAETLSNKRQKGPNLSVEGLRRGSGRACRCFGVQRVICSTADLPLWSDAEHRLSRWRWEARGNAEKAINGEKTTVGAKDTREIKTKHTC